jgi:hypothetical protein
MGNHTMNGQTRRSSKEQANLEWRRILRCCKGNLRWNDHPKCLQCGVLTGGNHSESDRGDKSCTPCRELNTRMSVLTKHQRRTLIKFQRQGTCKCEMRRNEASYCTEELTPSEYDHAVYVWRLVRRLSNEAV